jgi:rare lipoprotein A
MTSKFSVTFLVVFTFLIFLFHGCATVKSPPVQSKTFPTSRPYKVMGKWYQPMRDANDFMQVGKASWYGKKFHGRKTANGEIYDMYAISAAHKTLPIGTYVRVHNLNNNKKIVVRINDRGPFVRGRIIDLSYAAAKKIGIVGSGTAKVKILALGVAGESEPKTDKRRTYVPVNYYAGNFTFQVGAFRDRQNAERFRGKLAQKYRNAHITTYDGGDSIYYRVRLGKSSNLEQAAEYEKYLNKNGFNDAFIVAE